MMPEDNHDPAFDKALAGVDIFKASEAHRVRMRNMQAANDMIDPDVKGLETAEWQFFDERQAGERLRCRLKDAIEILEEALDTHAAARHQG